ncbi:MAG: hypothetical protein KDL87_04355, partial [Verrucomicrobiae bacterium]|nr:hypothetical protein [Verrucomicrobiae bacterium]
IEGFRQETGYVEPVKMGGGRGGNQGNGGRRRAAPSGRADQNKPAPRREHRPESNTSAPAQDRPAKPARRRWFGRRRAAGSR